MDQSYTHEKSVDEVWQAQILGLFHCKTDVSASCQERARIESPLLLISQDGNGDFAETMVSKLEVQSSGQSSSQLLPDEVAHL